MLGQLATSANAILTTGFRPSTLKTYSRMFRDVLTFLVATGFATSQVTTLIVLYGSFSQKHFSQINVANYITGIRSCLILYSLPTHPSRSEQIPLFLGSLRINARFTPAIKSFIDVTVLQQIYMACHKFQFKKVFQALYLFTFFPVLRISNILPHTITSFDPTRQLCRGDVIFGQQHATIIVTWSKTLQDRKT